MSEIKGLVFAFILDGKGGGEPIDFDGVRDWSADRGALWVHLDCTIDDAKDWLYKESGIDSVIVDALTAEETRPRSLVHKGGMLVILGGVNMNPGMAPGDMVSIRFEIEQP